MKRLLLINDNQENQISYWHIAFFLMSLPFDRFYSEIVLISFSLHILLHFTKSQIRGLLQKEVVILQSVFLLGIICIFYSANKNQAIDDSIRQLSIFIFPLIFCLLRMDLSKYRFSLLLLFSIACTFSTIYLFADAIHTILYYHLPLSSLSSSLFGNHNFSQPLDIHATYYSMYAAISCVFMLEELIKTKNKRYKIWYGSCCMILVAGLIQLSSKSVFFAMLIILNLAFPFMLFKAKERLKFLVISSIFCISIIVLILKIGDFKERYFINAKTDLTGTKNIITDAEPRAERWEEALKIIKHSPIIGYGSGTETELLKEKYFSEKMYTSYLNELNAHDEYLSLMIKSGFIGLSVYLFVLFFGIKQAIKRSNLVFLSFLILTATVSISENILDVNKGIFFYSFFFSFFIFSTVKNDQFSKKKTAL